MCDSNILNLQVRIMSIPLFLKEHNNKEERCGINLYYLHNIFRLVFTFAAQITGQCSENVHYSPRFPETGSHCSEIESVRYPSRAG